MKFILTSFSLLLFSIQVFGQNQCLSNAEAANILRGINENQTSPNHNSLRQELLSMRQSRETANQQIVDFSLQSEKYVAEADKLGEKQLLRFCSMIREKGWLRKESVGEDGVAAISFLLENSKNSDYQKQLLPIVIAAAKKGYIENKPVAVLIDGIRVGAGLPQIFGTQYEIRDELFFLYPLQSDAKVDVLRARYGLPPLWQFAKNAQSWYQMPVIKTPRPPVPVDPKKQNFSATSTEAFTSDENDEVVRVDSSEVNLNVRIPVDLSSKRAKLTKEDFEVYENGTKQDINFFSAGEQPIDLVLMMELRGWMHEEKNKIDAYAEKFIKAARPSDRIATFAFDGDKRNFSKFVSSSEIGSRTIETEIADDNRSGIWSEFLFAFNEIIKPNVKQGRRSIIVFIGEGMDGNLLQRLNPLNVTNRYSKTTFTDLVETVRGSETTIIPLYLNQEAARDRDLEDLYASDISMLFEKSRWLRKGARQGRRTLWVLANESGGQMYSADKPKDLDGIYDKILTDLSETYNLSYVPANSRRDGSWRGIEVKIKNHPEIEIVAKKGYYAR